MKRLMLITLLNLPVLVALSQTNKGQIEIGTVFEVYSNALKEQREYRVLLPSSYGEGEREYPVIYLLDGQAYYLSAYSAVKSLAGTGGMPEAIVVAISNPDRRSNMSPEEMEIWGVENPRASVFLTFLTNELIPLINKNYRTKPLNVLIGHSHGGIFNLYTLAKKPEAFRWHVVLDAPVHLDNRWLEKHVETFLKANPRHTGRMVVGWNRYGWSAERWEQLVRNSDKGFRVFEIDLEGETHTSMYHTGMYLGLKRLFADHEYQHTQIISFKDLERRYQIMNTEYGYDIPIAVWALRYGALEHLAAGEPEEAERFIERLEKDYGSDKILGDNGHEWLKSLRTSPPAINRAKYLAQMDADWEATEPFMGLWSNDQYEIRIGQKNGKPEAVYKQFFPDGEVMEMPIEKIVKTPEGTLELAYHNRVAPRSGIHILSLKLQENKVNVQTKFLVYWPRMEGRMKTEVFELVKKNFRKQ